MNFIEMSKILITPYSVTIYEFFISLIFVCVQKAFKYASIMQHIQFIYMKVEYNAHIKNS